MKWASTSLSPYVAVCALLACKTQPTTTDIRDMRIAGDVAGLIQSYDEVEAEAERAQILEALLERAESDESARMFLVKRGLEADVPGLKVLVLRGLSRLAPEIGARERIKLLADSSRSVREAAAESLEPGVADDAVLDRMLSAARADRSHYLRSGIARLVGGVAKSATMAPAVRALLVHMVEHDPAPTVREAAVVSLGRVGTTTERELLARLALRDPDAQVRMAAERASRQISNTAGLRLVIAVLPLKHGPKTKDTAEQVAEVIRARLARADVCDVVDPGKLEAALAEMNKVGRLVYDGDAPNAPELGKLKIANQLVYGSVQEEGNVFTIVLNRMDVSTLAIVPGSAVTVSGYRGDLPRLKEQAADLFVERFR